MKVLVTGSSGTVGTRLVEKLEGDHEVIAVDKVSSTYRKIDTTLIDLTYESQHFNDVVSAARPDIIVHLANHARVNNLVKNPHLALENMQMNFNVLMACRRHEIKNLVFASSREVYGNVVESAKDEAFGKTEDDALIATCESPYTASKLQGEALCHAFNNCYGINVYILRLSNVYGMYDFSDRVIPTWIRAIYGGRPLIIYGWNKSLDFTYIDDTVDGIMKAMDRVAGVSTFNISSGWSTPLIEAAQLLGEIVDIKPQFQIEPAKTGEVINYKANVEAANRYLSFRSRVGLKEGLEKAVAWYKEVGYV